MIQIFNLRVDPTSFWLGFLLGSVFIFILLQIRGQSRPILNAIKRQAQAARESMSLGAKARLLNDMYLYAQRQHLASGLFPLKDILITPRLMVSPVSPDAEAEFVREEVTHRVLPYMPDWPEAAAAYHAPSLSLAEALEGGAHILLIGQPGSGKSTALAHLVSQFATNDPALGKIAGRYPLLVHAAEILIGLNQAAKDPLAPLSSAVSALYASPLVQPRLRALLRSIFGEGSVLLLVDGLDEFDPQTTGRLREYLESLLKTFPGIQMAVSAGLENYSGLNLLGLVPTAMAGWSDHDRADFTILWRDAWLSIQKANDPNDLAQKATAELVGMWLDFSDVAATPFEQTLKTWAAFAGDLASSDLNRLLELHLARLGVQTNTRPGLEKLALEMILNQKILLGWDAAATQLRSGKGVAANESASVPAVAAEGTTNTPDAKPAKGKEQVRGIPPVVDSLVGAGILVLHSKDQVRIAHPLLTGLLAGRALLTEANPARLLEQPEWWGRQLSLGFLSCYQDITPLVGTLQQDANDLPTLNGLFEAARWLRLPSRSQVWRAGVMRSLANLLYKEYGSHGLSARAMCALAVSGDPTVLGLFRQMKKAEQPEVRRLAALGLGLAGDSKVHADLAALTLDHDLGVCQAACLALVRIGSKQAVDTVIGVLLHASEEMRRASAEALAAHPAEGLAILKEALGMDDLLVRRAALFGLLQIHDPEVTRLLEETAVSDGQWVVRNLAVQVLEHRRLPNPYVCKPLPNLIDLPWLLAYAARSGMGLVSEKEAMEMLLQAVERGEMREKLAALYYLNQRGGHLSARAVYNAYYGSSEPLHTAAFTTIWHLRASGAPLPTPREFGFG